MLDAIRNRRACRSFSSREVEDSEIKEIVEAGLLAPSGMNRQTPIIIVIKDKKARDELMNINKAIMGRDLDPFYGAPVILLVAAHKEGLSIHDGAACIENMLLEATNQGLASCWIHRAKEELEIEESKRLLSSITGFPLDDYIGVGHVIIGYPTSDYKPAPKVIKENRVFIK